MQDLLPTGDKFEQGGSGPRALRRVLQIAELLARRPEGATLAEIAVTLQAPKSSLLTILRALVEMQFAIRQGDQYIVGPALFNLAGTLSAQLRIAPNARPVMQRLHEKTGETVLLAELDRKAREIVYVDQIESINPVRYTANIGVRRPLYCSGAGRIILAYQTDEWRDDYLDTTSFDRLTQETVTDRDEILRRVLRARQEGIATSSGEVTDGGASYAAPVMQRDGSVHFALLVATVAIRLREKGDFYREAVIEAAAELSRLAGYTGQT